MNSRADELELVSRIQNSRKYRSVGIPEETILDVFRRENRNSSDPAEALRRTKTKLHNIMALYLGDIEYDRAGNELKQAFSRDDAPAVAQICRRILEQHHSTRERLPYYGPFFQTIQDVCGRLEVLLDLACGFNPFALPFINLLAGIRYHAYDIHRPRVELINLFFRLSGWQALAEKRDVLVSPPKVNADAAILLKEAHRMEKRRAGSSRELVLALDARVVFISLPNRSMDGKRDLRGRMLALMQGICGPDLTVSGRQEFPAETLFWLRKKNG